MSCIICALVCSMYVCMYQHVVCMDGWMYVCFSMLYVCTSMGVVWMYVPNFYIYIYERVMILKCLYVYIVCIVCIECI